MNTTLLAVLALLFLFLLAYEYLRGRFDQSGKEHFQEMNKFLLMELKATQREAMALAANLSDDDDEPSGEPDQAARVMDPGPGDLFLTPDDIAKIDAARGILSRADFIKDAIKAHLQQTFLVGRGGNS